MSLFSLIAVLLLEQIKPLDYRRLVALPVAQWAGFVETRLNAGERHQGMLAWAVAVGVPVVLVGVLSLILTAINPLLGWLLNVGVLYLTMGFRQFSHHYTEIQLALRMEDLPRARELLSEWLGISAQGMGSSEISRRAIEGALLASHRHVFAVLLWFVLLPGPCGAVLYRLALLVRDRWNLAAIPPEADFVLFARRLFGIIDWLPSRATACVFAIVGNFEDAIHAWRTDAGQWGDRQTGIVLASGAGALGVQLGSPSTGGGSETDGGMTPGQPASLEFMQSAVGLVWRAMVFWVLLLFLVGLATVVG